MSTTSTTTTPPPAPPTTEKPKPGNGQVEQPTLTGTRMLRVSEIDPDPANLRRHLGDLEGLITSIKEVGLLQPVIVRAHPSKPDRWMLVAGHRRLAAAKKAGLKTIEALHRTVPDGTAAELMLVENLQREDLKPLEEAYGYQQLVGLDWSQRKISERIGCNQSHVSRRLQLLKLTPTACEGVDAGRITVEDALELVKLADEPAAIDEIVKNVDSQKRNGTYGESITGQVRRHHEQKSFRAKITEVAEKLKAKGVRKIVEPKHRHETAPWNAHLDHLGIDPKAHADEPCHAMFIEAHYDKPRPVAICTDPSRHAARGGASTIKVAKEKLPEPSRSSTKPTAKERERRSAARTAEQAREEFMGGLVADGPNGVRASDLTRFVERRYLSAAGTFTKPYRQLCARLLDIKTDVGYGDDFTKKLLAFADQSNGHLNRAALAVLLVEGEENRWNRGGGQLEDEHARLLVEYGYHPAPGDLDAFKGLDVSPAPVPKPAPEQAAVSPPADDGDELPGPDGAFDALRDNIRDGDADELPMGKGKDRKRFLAGGRRA